MADDTKFKMAANTKFKMAANVAWQQHNYNKILVLWENIFSEKLFFFFFFLSSI